jgi:SAM-dependent methyltransferase
MAAYAPLLRCVVCHEGLAPVASGGMACSGCGRTYPVVSGTLRAVSEGADPPERSLQRRTADSFAYEWLHFGGLRSEWRRNFLDYMAPLTPKWLDGKLVLDLGAGSGRHAREAALCGARVVAVDIGDAIDVTRRNTPNDVLTIQADLEAPPLAFGAFDLVMSIGVLHHLPDPARALRRAIQFARPGGRVHIYVYWWPEVAWHRVLLRGVARVRRVTVRLPHRLLHALCYPVAALLFGAFVLPYRVARRHPRLARLAETLPLKTYADYPFGVCVNDQFDRFATPVERRFTRDEVEALVTSTGLEDVTVRPHHGWVASGRRPPA